MIILIESLSFIEERNLISVNQMTANRMSLIEKQKECAMQLMQTKEVLEVANNSALLIEKYNQLKNSIEENCSNPDYLLFEYENEKSLFEKIEKELKSKNLYTKEEQQKFQEDIKDYNERFADLVDIANTITNEIKQYDNCINVIREINIDDDYENNIENKLEDYHTSIDDDFER